MLPPLVALAVDCERAGAGLLAEPVNSLSSLAFLVVGVWVAWRARRAPVHRLELAVYGVVVATSAVGGVLYHGVGGPWTKWIHDLAIVAVLHFILVFDASRRHDRVMRWELYAIGLGAVAVLLAIRPVLADPLFAVIGIGAGVEEMLAYRHEIPALRREGVTVRRAARLGVVAAVALGGAAFWVGRTGAPLCSPGSAFQWHAVWHVLAALTMALYAHGAIELPSIETDA